jgi:[ribosomal protein S18]-alanine N-acetyltransferase
LAFRIDPMREDDIPEVSRVERRCFANPWPAAAYRRELADPQHNVYLTLRETRDGAEPPARRGPLEALRALGRGGPAAEDRVIGFAGMWHMFEEAHVTTIGVDGGWRGRGLGELLLLALVDAAMARGASWLTLEVRVSNEPAMSLYRKYGFSVQGTRKRYYSDNGEDAYIMWSPPLSDPETQALIERNRRALATRYPDLVDAPSDSTDPSHPTGAVGQARGTAGAAPEADR